MALLMGTGKIPIELARRPDQILQVNRDAILGWLKQRRPLEFQVAVWVNRMMVKRGATQNEIWEVVRSGFDALGMQVGAIVGVETGIKSKAIGYLAIKDDALGTPSIRSRNEAQGTVVTATWSDVMDCEFRYKNGNQADAALRRTTLERALQWVADGNDVPDARDPKHWMAQNSNGMPTMFRLVSISLSEVEDLNTDSVLDGPQLGTRLDAPKKRRRRARGDA